MTEIPEHLLKRSRDRRAALGLGGDDAGGEAGATPAATPATTGASAPAAAAPPSGPPARTKPAAPAPPPPPKPDPAYVAAAKTRPKIPFWAMGALSLLPIWMFMYLRSVTEAPEVVEGPLGEGAEVYGSCSSCHGAQGGGGIGRQFTDGEILLTFPHIEDQLRFVMYGTAGYTLAGVDSYGNPDRPGGEHTTGSFGQMPAQSGDLTDEEILGVVCHERYTLGGADPEEDEYVEEYETWCAEEAPVFLAIEGGATLATLHEMDLVDEDGEAITIIPIGEEPVAGSPPGEPASDA